MKWKEREKDYRAFSSHFRSFCAIYISRFIGSSILFDRSREKSQILMTRIAENSRYSDKLLRPRLITFLLLTSRDVS